jgi:hypothetical protein
MDAVPFVVSLARCPHDLSQTKSFIPLLTKVAEKAKDAEIWSAVYRLVTVSTPPLRPTLDPGETPISFTTASSVNTSEHRKDQLKSELGSSLYFDVPGFFDALFGEVKNLAEFV